MLDTSENIKETVQSLEEFFDTIDTSGEEYQGMDLSYLDD